MSKRYAMLGPGEGPNYDWENDHTYVKVSGRDTSGAYTLMEDNLQASFALGLHRHDTHTETFYFLEGQVDSTSTGIGIGARQARQCMSRRVCHMPAASRVMSRQKC